MWWLLQVVAVFQSLITAMVATKVLIDKDLSTTLLAKELNADILISPQVSKKCVFTSANLNKKHLAKPALATCNAMEEGHFPAVALPKIEASLSFIANGGKRDHHHP